MSATRGDTEFPKSLNGYSKSGSRGGSVLYLPTATSVQPVFFCIDSLRIPRELRSRQSPPVPPGLQHIMLMVSSARSLYPVLLHAPCMFFFFFKSLYQ